jgi:hypothetical protein
MFFSDFLDQALDFECHLDFNIGPNCVPALDHRRSIQEESLMEIARGAEMLNVLFINIKFSMDRRASPTISQRKTYLGLGLASSSRLVEMVMPGVIANLWRSKD